MREKDVFAYSIGANSSNNKNSNKRNTLNGQ